MLNSNIHGGKPFILGILGGGQLAKMIASAAYRMGINVAIIEIGAESPAGDMTKLEFPRGWFDDDELLRFAESCDIITLENEFIEPSILDKANAVRPVFPSPDTMRLVQDKFIQKQTFLNVGIPVPYFEKIDSADDLLKFGRENGYPFIVKTRTLGYDGYGNYTIENEGDCIKAWEKFNSGKVRPLMAERYINFTKELAVMVARNHEYGTVSYECVETIQENHICREVYAPVETDEAIRDKAREIAVSCVEAIDGTGVFGIELFLTDAGDILVNEIAPRPHNSGHYTIEACYTSQFENCIRAVCGLPLGSADMIKPAACMINLLGVREGSGVPADVTATLKTRGAWLHLYNKKQSRKGRKMGHITALGDNQEEARLIAGLAASRIIW